MLWFYFLAAAPRLLLCAPLRLQVGVTFYLLHREVRRVFLLTTVPQLKPSGLYC